MNLSTGAVILVCVIQSIGIAFAASEDGDALTSRLSANDLQSANGRRSRRAAGRTCGRSKYPDAGNMVLPMPRIVGGQEARPYEFPWQVSMRLDGDHFCGGSIIAAYWIITAAHCVADMTADELFTNVTIIVGEHKLDDTTSPVRQVFKVVNYTIGDYDEDKLFVNDIVLLKLSGNITFNDNVTSICLPDPTDTFINQKSVTSGWGDTSYKGQLSNTLLYVTLNTSSNGVCDDVFFEKEGVHALMNSTMCAQDNTGDRTHSDCQGDSGGPLAVKGADGSFTLAGLVSWGVNCSAGYPGVYTRVTYYLDFIRNATGVVPPAATTVDAPATTAKSDSPDAVVSSIASIVMLHIAAVFLIQSC